MSTFRTWLAVTLIGLVLLVSGCGDDGGDGGSDEGGVAPQVVVGAADQTRTAAPTATDEGTPMPPVTWPSAWTPTPADMTQDPNVPTNTPRPSATPTDTHTPGPTWTPAPDMPTLPPSWTPTKTLPPTPTWTRVFRPTWTPFRSPTPPPSKTPSNTPSSPTATAAGPSLMVPASDIEPRLNDLMESGVNFRFAPPMTVGFAAPNMMTVDMIAFSDPGNASSARGIRLVMLVSRDNGRVRLTELKTEYTDNLSGSGALFVGDITGLTVQAAQQVVDDLTTDLLEDNLVVDVQIADTGTPGMLLITMRK